VAGIGQEIGAWRVLGGWTSTDEWTRAAVDRMGPIGHTGLIGEAHKCLFAASVMRPQLLIGASPVKQLLTAY
jgi:hypothetical protein